MNSRSLHLWPGLGNDGISLGSNSLLFVGCPWYRDVCKDTRAALEALALRAVENSPQRVHERIVEQAVNYSVAQLSKVDCEFSFLPTKEELEEVFRPLPQECRQERAGYGSLCPLFTSRKKSRRSFSLYLWSPSGNEARSRLAISFFLSLRRISRVGRGSSSDALARASREGDGGFLCSVDQGESREDFVFGRACSSSRPP